MVTGESMSRAAITDDDVMSVVELVMDGPVVWGASDCCASVCDVFEVLHGVDPMASLRGRYQSEAEAGALIRAAGGWRCLVRDLARQSGLVPGDGRPGEIGLLRVARQYSLAIGLGRGMWAGRIAGGYAVVPAAEVMSCRI